MEQKNFKSKFNLSGKDMYPMLKEAVENKIDTLDILFNFNCFVLNKYCVCPKNHFYNFDLMVLEFTAKKGDKVFSNYSKYFKVTKFVKLSVNSEILNQIKCSFQTHCF